MKKHILYLLFFLSVMGLNTSCNYLDIVPDETATEADAFANPRATVTSPNLIWFRDVWTSPETRLSVRLPRLT